MTAGKYKEVLEYLNGRSMDDMLGQLEGLGFANASYLLGNLGAAAGLGPYALARLEVAIRSVGIRQTGTTGELLRPLIAALHRSGVRQRSDQFAAIRGKVPAPTGGWASLIVQSLGLADFGEFVVLTAADNAFAVLDFIGDSDLGVAIGALSDKQLRMLIVSNKAADRYDGERIRRALDAAWRTMFPQVEPPWPKAVTTPGLNVAAMSAGDKLAEALRRAEKYGGEELQGKLEELKSPWALAAIAGTTVLFAVLEGGTAGTAGVALLAVSALLVGPQVYQVVNDLNGFITTAVGAQDEAALDLAGQLFAKVAISISVDILIAVLLHKPTKMVTPKIQAGARVAGELLAEMASQGPKPSGQLVPALAMAGEGPRFVQAPPERLTPLATRGSGGAPSTAYDSMSTQQLRKLAPTDKAAAEVLVDRYHRMSDAQLRRKGADDQTAQAVLRMRTRPNDVEAARAQGENYRPPHSATVTVKRRGVEVSQVRLTSGNMTEAEAALGWPRNMLATHTEARAVRNPDLQPGDVMTIMGQYDPCPGCQRAMFTASRWLGVTINYVWMGGSMTFRP